MAFVCVDLRATQEYVSVNDPAIDHAKSDLSAYDRTLDRSFLAFNDGMEPTVFTFGAISSKEFTKANDAHIQAKANDLQDAGIKPFGLMREMVALGLRGVENALKADGETKFRLDIQPGNPSRVKERSMDHLQQWGVIEELGDVIRRKNSMDADEKKPLAPSSQPSTESQLNGTAPHATKGKNTSGGAKGRQRSKRKPKKGSL